jgi:hypothetical protein
MSVETIARAGIARCALHQFVVRRCARFGDAGHEARQVTVHAHGAHAGDSIKGLQHQFVLHVLEVVAQLADHDKDIARGRRFRSTPTIALWWRTSPHASPTRPTRCRATGWSSCWRN